jgi:hypothetical protein
MFADRRRLMFGAAMVVVLALAVWQQTSSGTPGAAAGRTTPARTPRVAADSGSPSAAVKPLKLDTLTGERAQPSETSRNPFRFEARAAAPRPETRMMEAEPARESEEHVPAGPPPLPPIALKFIGLVERANGDKVAVLSDGKATMHGKDGDIIDGRYRIVKIGTESIEMTYVDGRGRQVIRLTGQ